jgi:hypothetical protein
MLDDTVAVETVARPAARSPDKPALDYLRASGASAISITTDVGGAAITVGMKPDAVAVFWLPQAQARSVAARARAIMGDNPDTDAAISALQEAATECRVTLTPNDVVMARAANAARKLDEYFLSVRGTGTLKEFSKAYRRRRLAAKADGRGFMSCKIAEQTLAVGDGTDLDEQRQVADRLVAVRRGVQHVSRIVTVACELLHKPSRGLRRTAA